MAKLTREEGRRILRDAGLRATAPRVAVLRLLAESARPLSHAEVVDRIGTDDWDATTLYRNLVKLGEVGLARVASRADGITRFTAQTVGEPAHIHPHFVCRDCGDVTCLHEAKLTLTPRPTGAGGARDSKWREALLDADLQVVGRCPGCRDRRVGRGTRAETRA